MISYPLIPQVVIVEKISEETKDIKTFRMITPKGGVPFSYMPGQCAMLSVPGVGEAIFSITSSPTEKHGLDFSIKKTGALTDYLHEIEEGDQLGIRGPYGNGFPIEALQHKNLLFIGGGIGLAPLRSLIKYCLDNRQDFGEIDIVYGARTAKDLVHRVDLFENWPRAVKTNVYLTIDAKQEGWDGHVGFVPQYVEQSEFTSENRVALTCGPPVMIKYVLKALEGLNFMPEQIITTLELRMKCGIGKCGRCNIGGKYVCKDGPVFTYKELLALPAEY